MDEDIELGRQLALQCQRMDMKAFVVAVDMQLDLNRFDSEDGYIDLMRATLAASHGYTLAGGVIDFGEPESEE